MAEYGGETGNQVDGRDGIGCDSQRKCFCELWGAWIASNKPYGTHAQEEPASIAAIA
ncbi:MAG TPA: hypothetical protein PKG49_00705 [Nitrosomonas mobilis]|nr:hypothetical protein [Nitrosomonas mobilis]